MSLTRQISSAFADENAEGSCFDVPLMTAASERIAGSKTKENPAAISKYRLEFQSSPLWPSFGNSIFSPSSEGDLTFLPFTIDGHL